MENKSGQCGEQEQSVCRLGAVSVENKNGQCGEMEWSA